MKRLLLRSSRTTIINHFCLLVISWCPVKEGEKEEVSSVHEKPFKKAEVKSTLDLGSSIISAASILIIAISHLLPIGMKRSQQQKVPTSTYKDWRKKGKWKSCSIQEI